MIHRSHSMIEFECDDCGEIIETQEAEWQAALKVFKNEGWRSTKNGSQWEHYCDKCEGKVQYG